MLECGFAEFLYLGLPLSSKAQCLPQIKGGLCLAGCHDVAKTQGYHLVCIWSSLCEIQGGGVVIKFDVFFHSYEENFTFVTFKTDDSIKWKLMYSIISF